MPSSPIYQTFKRTSCSELVVYAELRLGKPVVSRLRQCLGGRRRNLPYWFSRLYAGDGKEKIGLSAFLRREKQSQFGVGMRWFKAKGQPPEEFGRIADLIDCLGKTFQEKEVIVVANFSYNAEKVSSIFKRIHLPEQSTIFDEIIGFTGIKRNLQGKRIYVFEVSLGKKRIEHTIRFKQTVGLSENLPLLLLETASKISELALRPKEG